MRFVSSVASAYTSFGRREAKGLIDARAVRPVHGNKQIVATAVQDKLHELRHAMQPSERREMQQDERRKVCRRIDHRSVLIELRSGIDRRHHNLRDGDVVEHIDEEA